MHGITISVVIISIFLISTIVAVIVATSPNKILELKDVDITELADGDFLQWNTSLDSWKSVSQLSKTSNGITTNNSEIQLGGLLTSNTVVDSNIYNLQLGTFVNDEGPVFARGMEVKPGSVNVVGDIEVGLYLTTEKTSLQHNNLEVSMSGTEMHLNAGITNIGGSRRITVTADNTRFRHNNNGPPAYYSIFDFQNSGIGESDVTYTWPASDGRIALTSDIVENTSNWASYTGTRANADVYLTLGNDDTTISINEVLGEIDMNANAGNTRLSLNGTGASIRAGDYKSTLSTALLSADRTLEFPDENGTLALTSDIIASSTSNWASYTGTRITADVNIMLGDYDTSAGNGTSIRINDVTREIDMIADDTRLSLNSTGASIRAGAYQSTLSTALLSADRTLEFPDENGTLALTSGIDAIVDSIIPLRQGTATGLREGGVLSVNADTTRFDISAGSGYILNGHTDIDNPTVTSVTWPEKLLNVPTYLSTENATYVGITINGDVITSPAPFSATQKRTNIYLGLLVHPNNTTIFIVNNQPTVSIELGAQVQDILSWIGFTSINGNRILPVGPTGMTIRKDLGTAFRSGANFGVLNTQPHTFVLAELPVITFRYRSQTGVEQLDTSVIDPTIYDSGGNFLTIPATATLATVQQVWIFQEGDVRIQPGQKIYNNLTEAVTGLNSSVFTTESNISNNGLYLGSIAMIRGTTNLDNILQAVFVPSVGTSVNGSAPYQKLLNILEEDPTVTGTKNINWLSDTFAFTLTGNTTFSDTNLPTGGGKKITLYVDATGSYTPTWPTAWYTNIKGSYVDTVLNTLEVEYVISTTPFWNVVITQPSTDVEEDTNVTGSKNINWVLDTFRYTLTGDTTFSDINLPATASKKIILYVDGDFTPTWPTSWTNIRGSYVPTAMGNLKLNTIEAYYVKTGTPFWNVVITRSD
jgi:hypothetical protein